MKPHVIPTENLCHFQSWKFTFLYQHVILCYDCRWWKSFSFRKIFFLIRLIVFSRCPMIGWVNEKTEIEQIVQIKVMNDFRKIDWIQKNFCIFYFQEVCKNETLEPCGYDRDYSCPRFYLSVFKISSKTGLICLEVTFDGHFW